MYTIPNDSFAGTAEQRTQATPGQTDFDVLAGGYGLTGVISGCGVAAQVSPNMTVSVGAGSIVVAGVPATVAGGNVTVTPNAGTSPRQDLIVADSAGALSAVAGIVGTLPAVPALPASHVALAEVYVAAGAAAVVNADIVDKRIGLHPNLAKGNVTPLSLGSGDVAPGQYQERFRPFGGNIRILGVAVTFGFGHGPVGADFTLDLMNGNAGGTGVSIWSTHPANRPKVLDGADDSGAIEFVPDTPIVQASESLRPFVIDAAATPGAFCVAFLRWIWV